MANVEKTLVLVKPDGVKKHICGEVISLFERKGLILHSVKMIQVPEELAKKHYAEHAGKGFFNDLISFITSGPVLAMVIEVAKSPRIDPGTALIGSVAPLI